MQIALENQDTKGGEQMYSTVLDQRIDEEAEDIQSELYDDINSLYNMENPTGDQDDKRSVYSS